MRYNIFNQIHKGLRAMLFETALHLQHANFQDEDEAEQAIEKVKLVVRTFDDHAHHEDHFVLPAIAEYEPSVVDAFEQEHVQDLKLGQQLLDSLQALDYASPAVKPEMGIEVNRSFIAFMVFNLTHMAKEEDVINKLLWRYYSDAELLNLNQKIVASLSPWSAENGSTWMMRGLNNTEISIWLKGVQAMAPEPVFLQLLQIAEKELPEERFQFLADSLAPLSAFAKN